VDAWIERSSGSAVLDRAALRMMHDASPVPPPPSYRNDNLSLSITVSYTRAGLLRRLFQ
jgi:TonB family protein